MGVNNFWKWSTIFKTTEVTIKNVNNFFKIYDVTISDRKNSFKTSH